MRANSSLFAAVFDAAALIRARCSSENPPEMVDAIPFGLCFAIRANQRHWANGQNFGYRNLVFCHHPESTPNAGILLAYANSKCTTN